MMSDAVNFWVSVSVAARAVVVRTPAVRAVRVGVVATVAVRDVVARVGVVAARVITPLVVGAGVVARD